MRCPGKLSTLASGAQVFSQASMGVPYCVPNKCVQKGLKVTQRGVEPEGKDAAGV